MSAISSVLAPVDAEKIPDERNAFVFFRQAAVKLRRMPDVPRTVLRAGPEVGWQRVDPKVRDWVGASREVLDLFRKAAEQADGWAHPGGE